VTFLVADNRCRFGGRAKAPVRQSIDSGCGRNALRMQARSFCKIP
jgi:hypothetical protein